MEKDNRRAMVRVVMLPKDTNQLGHIFGGVILAQIDLAAGVHARQIAPHKYVTKIFREVDFIAPVQVGDIVSYYTETMATGKSSVTIKVSVESTRGVGTQKTCTVTEAEVVMVAVDDSGKSKPIKS